MHNSEEVSTSKSLILMNEDIPEVGKMLTTTSANILRNLSSITYSSYNMLHIDPTLCLASLSIIPMIGSSAVLFLKVLSKLKKQLKSNMIQCNEFWEERVNLLNTVQYYNRQSYEIEHCDDILKEYTNIGSRYSLWYGGFMGSMFTSTCVALLGVVGYGMNRINTTSLSSGNFTSFATYSVLLGVGTTGFLDTLSKLRHGYDCAKRVFSVIDIPHETQHFKDTTIIDPSSIVIHDVSYKHPGATSPTLRNINLTLEKGKSYAIVGKNGTGKSTLVNLLSGSLQPTQGTISIHTPSVDVNLHNLDPHTQSNYIGIIPQSPHLFNTTIYDNIIYSKPSASPSQVKSLLKLCNIHEITQTTIGKNGCNISGGQRQRIALARVLLHNPELLFILDEPMNNLDNDGMDMLLKDAVFSKKDKAVVLVTHDKECLNFVDEIIVLADGEIVGCGSWSDLKGVLDEVM